MARHGLGTKKRTLQVGVEDAVPERLVDIQRRTDLLDAGVVEQYVDTAKQRGRSGHALPAGRHLGDIHADGHRLGARGADRSDDLVEIRNRPRRHRDRCARRGVRLRQSPTDTPAGPGDEHTAANEGKSVQAGSVHGLGLYPKRRSTPKAWDKAPLMRPERPAPG